MGQWFWRWLCFFAGVLLTAACGQSPSARSETAPPTLLRFTPSAANLPIGSFIRPAITATPSHTLPALLLTGPLCYETPVQSLVCLGWIHNPLETAQENILLNLKLIGDQGEIIAVQSVAPAHAWLPSQSGAPYRFVITSLPDVPVTPQLSLLTASPARENGRVALEVDIVSVYHEGIVCKIAGKIHNKSPVVVKDIQIVVTVKNAAGSVMGFRTLIQTQPSDFETTLILVEPYAETFQVIVTADGMEGK